MEFEIRSKYDINDLLKIMEILRSESGCPWDREQTHKSIRKNFIEETYEVCEAIDTDDKELLKEELGDALLQVVFHSRISEEDNDFDFSDVVDGICKKLVVRHPHVFGNVTVDNSDQVLTNWEKIKAQTKGQTTYTDTLNSVPKTLPSLMRAEKVQSRAAKSGFDYDDIATALSDLKSEIAELEAAINNNDSENIAEELGDLLFSTVNVSRFAKLDSEYELSMATEKFIKRFNVVEKLANDNNIDLKSADFSQMDKLWKQAKQIAKNSKA